jgi:hypothetical protein
LDAHNNLSAWEGTAFPNPAHEQVKFILPAGLSSEVDVYNVYGEHIANVRVSHPTAEPHVVAWNCRGMAPGIYLAHLKVDGRSVRRVKFALAP